MGLILTYSNETAASFNQNALVAFPVHVLRVSLKAKQGKYSIHPTHFARRNPVNLPVDSGEIKTEGGDAKSKKKVPRYGLTSSKVVPVKTATSLTFSFSSRRKQISAFNRTKFALLDPLKNYGYKV